MSKESRQPNNIDPKLEARLVALALGEASDFERAELEQLIAERPELKVFQKEIQQVHAAMQVVGQGEIPSEDDAWKLSKEKRQRLIATFDGKSVSPAPNKNVVQEKWSPLRRNVRWRNAVASSMTSTVGSIVGSGLDRVLGSQRAWKVAKIAAVVGGIALVGGTILVPASFFSRQAASRATAAREDSSKSS